MEKRYRYFWTLLGLQARWLDKMSDGGLRLVRTEKLLYEFEPCDPGEYRYCVEFVAHLSRDRAEDYARFLEDCGYRVWFKNANLDWNVGKVEARPWAEPGGRLASNATTYNRELLIVEKKNDGKPFQLHSSNEDKARYYIPDPVSDRPGQAEAGGRPHGVSRAGLCSLTAAEKCQNPVPCVPEENPV